MRIELLYFSECPNGPWARQLLAKCMGIAGVEGPFEERDGEYASPTILVNGIDVMGQTPTSGRACRLDVPTEERVLAVLTAATADPR